MKAIATIVVEDMAMLANVYHLAESLKLPLALKFVEEQKTELVMLGAQPKDKKYWAAAVKLLKDIPLERLEFVRRLAQAADDTPKTVGTRVAKWLRDGNLKVSQ